MKRYFFFLRRILPVFLALALLCSCAQAAPARDVRRMELKAGENLRSLVSLFGAASLLRDVRSLGENETSEPFLEGVLVLGLSRGLLPRTDDDPADGVETLTPEAARRTLSGLLGEKHTDSSFDRPTCPCISRKDGELTVDYRNMEAETAGGARIFSIQREGDRLSVMADVYVSLASWQTNPQEVAEDCLTWEYTARFVLAEAEPSGPDGVSFGYTLVSMDSFPEWEKGCLDDWRSVREDRFSFILPPFFSRWNTEESPVTGDKTYTFASDDGQRLLTVTEEKAAANDPLGRFRTDVLAAHPDARVAMEPMLRYATAETSGEYDIVFAPKGSGEVFTFTMRFPAERQYEYSFIGEMIRNSFWCVGVPMG